MKLITFVGILAAIFSTSSFLPQAIKTIRTKHVTDLSLIMYIVYSTGVVLWLTYGLMLKSWPIIIANVVTLIFTLIILVQIIKYK